MEMQKPRRGAHRKSRRGCTACKARHVKCDEQGPPCANCTIRNVECIYIPTPRRDQSPTWVIESYNSNSRSHSSSNSLSPVRRPPATISPLSLSSSESSNRLLELELMHRWSVRTWQGMYSLPTCQSFLQEDLPRQGLRHGFILDGIMALAAVDASLQASSSSSSGDRSTARRYRRAALEYCNKASAAFRVALNMQTITRDTLYLLATFGCMAGYFNLIIWDDDGGGGGGRSAQTSMLDRVHASFVMFVGCAHTAALNWQWFFDSPTSARVAAEEYYPRLEFMELIDPQTKTAINRLSTVNRLVRLPLPPPDDAGELDGDSSEEKKRQRQRQGPLSYDVWSYRIAVGQTKYAFAEQAVGRIKGFLISVPCMCGPEVIEGLRTREPVAMFVLMYWGVLLDACAADPWLWWAAGRTGRDVVEAASAVLVRSPEMFALEDVREGITWARGRVGLDPLVPVVRELVDEPLPVVALTHMQT
ncbi:hypothetical protein JDV02_010632 [Purpureocillium takamizusanense]|uniref:Zn(2)-C6 fungal-type domain-containing protein n=1 Tax=Purpureocillium takamizusanense TaxID=2060973 RepID=A0A9Q8QSD4_9HYPO|nr:uncharacterized protein JDV02_010632 [Purpureocillium takamizusanense]UNI24915.1 hypothetical protein JDV02_010632 [Purpureocillium takamizusanense]